MSEVFEGYERQYCELSAHLSRKCSSTSLVSDPEKKVQKISEIKAGLDDADVLIRKMDHETRSLQPSVKAMLLGKLKEYQSNLINLNKEFKRLTSPNSDEASPEELWKTGMADTHLVYLEPKIVLLDDILFLRQKTKRDCGFLG